MPTTITGTTGVSQVQDGVVTADDLAAGVGVGVFESKLLHVQHQEASGVNGGDLSDGDNDRTINTILVDEIGISGVSSPEIQGVPSGVYYIEADVSVFKVALNRLRLRDVTGSTDLVLGLNTRGEGSTNFNSDAKLSGRFTLSQTSNLKIINYATSTPQNNGQGYNVGDGNTEVYLDCKIWKVG
jgi:hypothetical protein